MTYTHITQISKQKYHRAVTMQFWLPKNLLEQVLKFTLQNQMPTVLWVRTANKKWS